MSDQTKPVPPGQVQPIVRRSTFGDWIDIGAQGAVVLATNDGHGLTPRALCLPHQLYVEKVRELEQYGTVTAIPVRCSEYVELPNAGLSGGSPSAEADCSHGG